MVRRQHGIIAHSVGVGKSNLLIIGTSSRHWFVSTFERTISITELFLLSLGMIYILTFDYHLYPMCDVCRVFCYTSAGGRIEEAFKHILQAELLPLHAAAMADDVGIEISRPVRSKTSTKTLSVGCNDTAIIAVR